MKWSQQYPNAFPIQLGPFDFYISIHHPDYAKTLLSSSGTCVWLFSFYFNPRLKQIPRYNTAVLLSFQNRKRKLRILSLKNCLVRLPCLSATVCFIYWKEKRKVCSFCHINTFPAPVLGKGLLTLMGDKWIQHRRLVTPGFHYEILKSYIKVMSESAHVMLVCIRISSWVRSVYRNSRP